MIQILECGCNPVGVNASTASSECDVHGQCPCLPNWTGQQCDHCALEHYVANNDCLGMCVLHFWNIHFITWERKATQPQNQ